MAPEMEALNKSLPVDIRLWPQDIAGSRAWARALAGGGVIAEGERDALLAGLDRVASRLAAGEAAAAKDEDVHSLVERLLYEEAGDVAGKLHTGRSRNDQVSTDFRLWGVDAVDRVGEAVRGLCRALHSLASRSVDLIMPAYTHLQRAQPVRAAHWALSHFWPFDRDRRRLAQVRERISVLPLGSGAVAGSPFPIDRDVLRRELGFAALSENSMDAVSDRDWVMELAFVGALAGAHLSRLAEDLVLFGSSEFGFLRLDDRYSTGSSLMPQKRNPDVAELARGKSGRLTGNLVALLTLLKGLPTSYNRDIQEDKELLFDSVDTLLLTLPALAGALETALWNAERVAAGLDDALLATDLADYLVRKGVPFRESHEIVGRLVRRAEEEGRGLSALPDAAFREAHSAFGTDVREVFSWERAVEARAVPGGTARQALMSQLEEAGRRLAAP
ncbi:MAG: argininosuccinate lyase [Gemmatimonadetes bacterium]|nr:argininosuccinate lyase [Gemmatimonadota bacterium]